VAPEAFMKFHIAETLQRRWVESPPAGWTAKLEVPLLDRGESRILGYQPKADLMLQHCDSSRRVWIELEISRADPSANQVKFGSAHLLCPLPPGDAFVSLVTRGVVPGRSNLAAHAIWLLRACGLRAFQMPLLPEFDAAAIKQFNQGKVPLDRLLTPDLGEIIASTEPVASSGGSGIYRATNRLEVILNILQWNKDMTDGEARAAWGRRRVTYFVHDPASNLFAPSKFAAYTRIPEAAANDEPHPFNPAMTVRSYSKIPHDTPIFDGRKAWQRIASLSFQVTKARDCPPRLQEHFRSWLAIHEDALHSDLDEAEILIENP
jgi:hypothetical protein